MRERGRPKLCYYPDDIPGKWCQICYDGILFFNFRSAFASVKRIRGSPMGVSSGMRLGTGIFKLENGTAYKLLLLNMFRIPNGA